jgi:hypothetical protein
MYYIARKVRDINQFKKNKADHLPIFPFIDTATSGKYLDKPGLLTNNPG